MFGRDSNRLAAAHRAASSLADELMERIRKQSLRLNDMRGELERVKLELYQAKCALAQYALDDIRRDGT